MKKKIYRAVLFGVLLTLAQLPAFAQEPEKNSNLNSEWIRVASDNGEMSFEAPSNLTYFYDKDGFKHAKESTGDSGFLHFSEFRMISAAEGKTVMSVEIYKISSPEKGIKFLVRRQGFKLSTINDLTSDFTGTQTEITTYKSQINGKKEPLSCVIRFVASKTHLYVVTVANRGERTDAFNKFLSSIRFGENQIPSEKMSSFKALGIEDIIDQDTTPVPPKSAPDKEAAKNNPPHPTPLVVLVKPFTSYTGSARNNFTTGNVLLRLTFEKTGRISKIRVVKGLPDGLNRQAFFAALRIKFLPPEKDGVPETVTKSIEYSFKIG